MENVYAVIQRCQGVVHNPTEAHTPNMGDPLHTDMDIEDTSDIADGFESMSGQPMSGQDRARLAGIQNGSITADQAVAEIMAEYAQPKKHWLRRG